MTIFTKMQMLSIFLFFLLDVSSLNAANTPPTITSTAVTIAMEDSAYSYTLSGSDVDGDLVTFSVMNGTTLPSWLDFHSTLVTTFAGDGSQGSLDANGTKASFNLPSDVAVDSKGNIYVADTNNNKIRKITPSGVVTTFAGSGALGSTDGNTTSASFMHPQGVAVDSLDNLYVAESSANKIRKITPLGVVTTLAGSGSVGSTDGNGTSASFSFPSGVTVDKHNNVYVADSYNNKIRKITPLGVVTTIAGNGSSASIDGNGTSASFFAPFGITVDSQDNIYVADTNSNKIRKITSTGVVTTFAGSGLATFADGNGTSASFNQLKGIIVDSHDNIYVADAGNKKIRKITPLGVVTTIAGSGAEGSTDGYGTSASFKYPYGVAVDTHDNIYVAENVNKKIRKIIYSQKLVGTPINADVGVSDVNLTLSDGQGGVTPHNFQITVVNVNDAPTDITLSNSSITENNVTGATIGILTTTDIDAGDSFSYSFCGGSDDANFSISGDALQANAVFDYETKKFYDICIKTTDNANVSFDKNITITIQNVREAAIVSSTAITAATQDANYEYVLFGHNGDNDIVTFSVTNGTTLPSWLHLSSNYVTTFAGSGAIGAVDGKGSVASFNYPDTAVFDSHNNLYVIDTNNHKIRKITPAGIVTTFSGTSASFDNPYGIAIDRHDAIYVADSGHHKIIKITQAGVATTLAGSGSWGATDGVGQAASFYYPSAVVVDSHDNVYVADSGNCIIRKITQAGVVTTFAGNGTIGASDGIGQAASFSYPYDLAIDSHNNIYVADTYNNKIRKISPAGIVTTLAGNGSFGATDGNGANASFNYPWGVAVDHNDNIYVADSENYTIRKITPTGVVSTFAGNGSFGATDGSKGSASFTAPHGVAIDKYNDIYIIDRGNHKIRKIVNFILKGTPTNADVGVYDINLTLSDGNGGEAMQNFQITVANVNDAPTDITLSNSSITENNVTGATIGILTTTDIDAGDSFSYSFCGGSDDANFSISGDALQANAVFDYETKASYSTCIRTTDSGNATFDKNITISIINVNDAPTITSTVVTSVMPDSAYDYVLKGKDEDKNFITFSVTNGTTLPSWLHLSSREVTTPTTNLPVHAEGMIVDKNDNIYAVDLQHSKIKKITPAGVVTIIAGSGTSGAADGNGTSASFNQPSGIAQDSHGNLYVTDTLNNKIRKITPAGEVSTFAGSGSIGGADGMGTAASFYYPYGIVVDSKDNIYVADQYNHRIRKITPAGEVSTFAGSGQSVEFNADGPTFNYPKGLAIDSNDNIYVADEADHKIKKITPNGLIVTLAGGSPAASVDGLGLYAHFNRPFGVTVDSEGNVYVADTFNNKIRKITPKGLVSTIAGNGITASFNNPKAIAVDSRGYIYVNDGVLRKIAPTHLTGTPTNADVGVYDINLTLTDTNGAISTQNFQISVGNVNSTPTSANNTFTIVEDTQKVFSVNDFNFTDSDTGDTIDSIFITTLPSVGTLTLNGVDVTLKQKILKADIANLRFTPVVDAIGSPYATFGFKVNDGDANSTVAYITTINVTAAKTTQNSTNNTTSNSAPVLTTLENITRAEDFTDFNITLVATDADKTQLIYSAKSTDTSIATVTVSDNILTLSSVPDVNGKVVITYDVTDGSLSDAASFTLYVTPVDDAPIFAQLADLVTLEDARYSEVTLNAKDVDGDLITYSATSSDTSIATVAIVDGKLTITQKPDANGVVTIEVVATANGKTTKSNLKLSVSSVNDAPTLSSISDVVVYKNTPEKNITLDGADVDGDKLTYTSTFNPNVIKSINFTRNVMQIIPTQVAASTDVNITLSDGELNTSTNFTFTTIAFENGSNLGEVGSFETNATTTMVTLDNNVTLIAQTDTNGTIQQYVTLDSTITGASTDLVDAIVTLISNGVQIIYDDNSNVVAKSLTTILGEAIQTMQVGDALNQAIFTSLGVQTVMDTDADGKVEIVSTLKRSDGKVTVVLRADGSAEYSVSVGDTFSKFFSSKAGMTMLEGANGEIKSSVGAYDDSKGYFITAVVTTYKNGNSSVKFIRVNQRDATDSSDFRVLSSKSSPLPLGTKIHLYESSTVLYMNVELQLEKNFIIQ